jgi:membrane-associated phospholipid phosphatase
LAALTGVLDLIVFNKVGSPQFMIWLAVPLIALVYFGINRSKFALVIGSAILLLTQLVYPVFYIQLLGLETLPLWLLTIRNLMLVTLLVWANVQLSKKADLATGQVRR